MMKTLQDYLSESEYAAANPVAGDTFAINIREECLIESVVLESRDDGVVIAADDRMIQLLESYGYTFEQNCMECGMMECGCGDSAAYRDDEEQDAGEYDQEGSMAKDDLNTIVDAASRLMSLLGNNDNMPEWTQSKIDRAADYVDTAADYIQSKKSRGVMEQDVEEGPEAKSADEIHQNLLHGSIKHGTHDVPGHIKAVMKGHGAQDYNKVVDLVRKKGYTGKIEQGVSEGSEETSPVARAVLHRIMMAHPGVLAQHGPEKVMSAVDELADWVGDVDEIGTSDVSGWVRDVIRMLAELPDESMSDVDRLEEGPEFGEIDDTWMNDKHKEFYKRNPHFKRNNRDRVEVGNRLATQVKPSNPQQVQKKPATPFGMAEGLGDYIGRKMGVKVTQGKPNPNDAPRWATALGQTPEGAWHWLEKNGPTETPDSDRYFPLSGKTEFTGFVSDYDQQGMSEAEYQGRKVPLGKPMRGDVKKSKVYVKNPQGNVVKVNFGDPDMKIKKSNPERRKSFRARHNCDNPGPRHKARYWSCRAW